MADNNSDPVLTDIMEYDELHYFGQYIHQKSKTVNVTGFSNEFPITMDMVKNDIVFEDFYSIFYNRATGASAKRDHYIVNTWEPVTGQENTYKARKIKQTVEITECNGAAGEQKQISGSLKGGDFVYGTFNTSTKTFTENAKIINNEVGILWKEKY